MFKNKHVKKANIDFELGDSSEPCSKPKAMQPKMRIAYEDDNSDNDWKSGRPLKKIKRIDSPVKSNAIIPDTYTSDYLRDLIHENKMSNIISKKSLEQQNEITIIDVEESDPFQDQAYIEDAKQARRSQQAEVEYISLDTDDHLVSNMDKKRMAFLGPQNDRQKPFFLDNSDEEEFNRLESDLIKANKIPLDHKASKPQRSSLDSVAPVFVENIQQINLTQILSNLKSQLSAEARQMEQRQQEYLKSKATLSSSRKQIEDWTIQKQRLREEIYELEWPLAYFVTLHDMLKEKAPLMFQKLRLLDDVLYEYKEDKNEQQLASYCEALHEVIQEVDLEYLDLDRISTAYERATKQKINPAALQLLFDYLLLHYFLSLYLSGSPQIKLDLFVTDPQLNRELLKNSRVLDKLVLIGNKMSDVVADLVRQVMDIRPDIEKLLRRANIQINLPESNGQATSIIIN